MNKNETIKCLKEDYFANSGMTKKEILTSIQQDYEDLIELRNRIKEGADCDTILYEEDSITLDHCLDYLELFMKHLGIGE